MKSCFRLFSFFTYFYVIIWKTSFVFLNIFRLIILPSVNVLGYENLFMLALEEKSKEQRGLIQRPQHKELTSSVLSLFSLPIFSAHLMTSSIPGMSSKCRKENYLFPCYEHYNSKNTLGL